MDTLKTHAAGSLAALYALSHPSRSSGSQHDAEPRIATQNDNNRPSESKSGRFHRDFDLFECGMARLLERPRSRLRYSLGVDRATTHDIIAGLHAR